MAQAVSDFVSLYFSRASSLGCGLWSGSEFGSYCLCCWLCRNSFNPNKLRISLGVILLMDGGQPLPFDSIAASNYLKKAGEIHGMVVIQTSIGKIHRCTKE